MFDRFDPNSGAILILDEQERVTGISHFCSHWVSDEETPREAAVAYIRSFAELLKVTPDCLRHINEPVSYLEPDARGVEYRVSEETTSFDSTTVEFKQTVLNTPVWNAGLTVTVKHGPYRVIGAAYTGRDWPAPTLPPSATIDRYRRIFALAESERMSLNESDVRPHGEQREEVRETAAFVRTLLADNGLPHESSEHEYGARLVQGRFCVYRFDPERRLAEDRKPAAERAGNDTVSVSPPPLASVPPSIKPGQYYVVAEVTFASRALSAHRLVWRALVELETGVILYLRPLAAGVSGLVFPVDPITASGDATKTADKSNAVLNPFRKSAALPNLDGPTGGEQSLKGPRVRIVHQEGPAESAPTESTGSPFNFQVRTDDFAAVNAYYHAEKFFETLEDLGFSVATYFKNTLFPLEIDHAGPESHTAADGLGGIDHVCFRFEDLSVSTNPVGRACDSRVMWHELGGHGTLIEQVRSLNFGFAHSAGDSLSAIFHAPESNAPDPFEYAPFHPDNDRRFDRKVTDGWAWGGIHDEDKAHESEQILTTTLFRVYLSIGGGAPKTKMARRKFASRMMLYLILRTIQNLTESTNPLTAKAFAKALMETDDLNWTSEGVFGGAYKKVIRWSFEKQGLFQPAGAKKPVATEGQPPDMDVYIDDGRAGEYQYQDQHSNTTTIWNRIAGDGQTAHQTPRSGQTNFAYVKIKNRGIKTATQVKVRGFHSRPSAGLLWPNDFQPMTTDEIAVGTLAANETEEKIVGPFHWTPVANASGEDCLLMVASASEDPSNIDSFVAGEVIEDWRLVPNDNNIGLRIVSFV